VLALSGGEPTPTAARLVTGASALAGLAAFAALWRRWHGARPGAAVLLVALLPILQPYTGMVYTDVTALALVLAAAWAQFGGRPWVAGALLAAACLVRQTSVIWGTCFVAIEVLRDWPAVAGWPDRLREAARRAVGRAPGILAVHVAVAAIVLWAGRLTPGTQHGNALHPNLATVHFGGVLLAALTLPLWPRLAPAAFRLLAARPGRILAAAAAVAALALLYRNPHVWNRELWWPDTPFTLLRNWPLVGADRWWLLRWAWSLLAVAGALGAVAALAGQPRRRELVVVAGFSAVLLATNGLVEPRYFITPAVLALLFVRFSRPTFVRLAAWFALLSAAHAPFILGGLSLW
jgi:alpha-1,2-glucosyltransferase